MKKSKCGHWTHTEEEGLTIGEHFTIWGWYQISNNYEEDWGNIEIRYTHDTIESCPDCGEELE